MEELVFLMMALIGAHVATVYFITRSQKDLVEQCRQMVLDREETERQYYVMGDVNPETDRTQDVQV
jgi:hypothetical protein